MLLLVLLTNTRTSARSLLEPWSCRPLPQHDLL